MKALRQEELPLTHRTASLCVVLGSSVEWMIGEGSLLDSVPMFISSPNTLTDTPGKPCDQTSGCPVVQPSPRSKGALTAVNATALLIVRCGFPRGGPWSPDEGAIGRKGKEEASGENREASEQTCQVGGVKEVREEVRLSFWSWRVGGASLLVPLTD